MADRVGKQLGNYRLKSVLGEGGFAEVYLGEHIYLGSQAAIKVLYTRLDKDDQQAFLNEARTIVHLKHAHIVRVLEFGIDDTIPFLVMDYAPNGTLRERHPKGATLSSATILPYVKQVTEALQYAHNQKVIHRDVKPENFLIGEREEVLLSDFGIAIIAHSTRYQQTEAVAGTAAYMAPEQFQGKPCPASDQYSLGIVVYEWLCGERPFHGSFLEISGQHLHQPPPPLRERLADLPPPVEAVVFTALAKDPQQRFASMRAFAAAFEQASLADHPTQRISSPSSWPSTVVTQRSQPQAMTTPPQFSQPSSGPVWSGANVPSSGPVWSGANVSPSSLPTMQEGVERARPGVSRRTFLIGITAVAAIGGGAAWLALARGPGSSSASPGSLPAATASSVTTTKTAQPSGTTPVVPGTTLAVFGGHTDTVYALAWSPDGSRIASCGGNDQTVQVWDAATGRGLFAYRRHAGPLDAIAWAPNGQRIVSGGPDVQVWNATDGSYLTTLALVGVEGLAWSRDGRYIAAAGRDNAVHVWDAATGNPIAIFTNHSDIVLAVAWSPNGQQIASVSRDTTLRVWNLSSGDSIVYTGHSASVNAVAWSPDGRSIVTGSTDRTARVWDANARATTQIYGGHNDAVEGIAWSPNGERIASASRDATVQLWTPLGGTRQFTYTGHFRTVWSVAWSPDGQRIASGSVDKTVRVWQA